MKKDKVKEIFDTTANTYDKTWEKLSPISNSLHLLMGAILSELPEKAKILCVGAGTGAEIIYMANRFPTWNFIAVDPSSAMLDICRTRLYELGMEDRCEFYADYLENLSLPDTYDAATSILVSQFIDEKDSRIDFFRNIQRHLKSKGILINADLSNEIGSYEYEHILDVWSKMMSEGGVPQNIEKIRQSHKDGVSLLAQEEVSKIIQSAGFDRPVQFYQMAFIHGWFCQKRG